MHFFLWKIASKIQVRLILEINIKMSSVWFKIPTSLKMAISSMTRETYLYLPTMDSTGGSNAQMRRIWVAGIHKLANTVSLLPRHHKPGTTSSLCCVIAVYGVAELILQPSHHFTYITTHSPTLPSVYLRYSSFSNPSVTSPTSQFILQPFYRLSYITSSSLNSPREPPTLFVLR